MNFARVTLRDQQRVGKGLVERMRFNLVQMLRYLYHRLSIEGSAYLFVDSHIMLFLELEFVSCFTVPTYPLIVMQLLHQSSFSQGINYGNSQVYSLFFPLRIINCYT